MKSMSGIACRAGLLIGLSTSACQRSVPAASPADACAGSAQRGRAYEMVMQATSCWMGGLWSDALGEKEGGRFSQIEHRCGALLLAEVAAHEGSGPLRAVEPRAVDALAQKVHAVAERDSAEAAYAGALVALLRAVADTMRETLDARRAADLLSWLKESAADPPQVEVRDPHQVVAAAKLQRAAALDALFRFDQGPFAEEAHAVAVLTAVDRMEIARGLPTHLEVYAVQTAYQDVFGVAPPPVPGDAAAPLPTGTWLAYLSDVAVAAGHPVPSDARDPQHRGSLAWTGVLQGFADRLRMDAQRLAGWTPLGEVESAIITRLEDVYRGERAVYEARAPPDR